MWREIKRRKDGNTDLGLNRGGGTGEVAVKDLEK